MVCDFVEMLTTPFSSPTMLGVKMTVIVQVPPAGIGEEDTQLSVSEKSPPAATVVTINGAVPAFESVKC
jgi:hypothetical protein